LAIAGKSACLDDARLWLNDQVAAGEAVKVEGMLETPGTAFAVMTATGLLLHWRNRFPEAAGDPEGGQAWYAIGSGEGEPGNYIKTSFNLSLLPERVRVLTVSGLPGVDIELSDGVWLRVRRVGRSLA
jgi:hypothetical protein